MNPSQAFDPLATSYDDTFTHTQIGRYLRDQVHARLDRHFRAGDHVLELGCGTGEDALRLAERGVQVTATDVSEGMLAAARAKTAGNVLVHVEQMDLRTLTPYPPHDEGEQLDGVFSNFGPMNCLEEWGTLASWLAKHVKQGGIVGLGVMSPLCMWEPLWHGLHGNFKTAMRRWRKKTVFHPDGVSEPITVTYPSISRITKDFAPHFRRVYVQPLGLFLPPSDVYGAIEKRPRLFNTLMALEKRFGQAAALAMLADHYWIEFQKI